ncbi:MAG: hypothetical protein KKD17_06255 [Nanoarchaeota archaeon]|nr:hypothetical protein [Nanoarchaeota archaeon]
MLNTEPGSLEQITTRLDLSRFMRSPGQAFLDRNLMAFLQELASTGEIVICSATIDKEETVQETGTEKLVRIRKGATLEPVERMEENREHFVRYSETGDLYLVRIGSDAYQYITTVARLIPDLDLTKVREFYCRSMHASPQLEFPEGSKTAELTMNTYYYDIARYGETTLTTKGEDAGLIKHICRFMEEKAKLERPYQRVH